VWGGLKEGMVDIAPLNPAVPDSVAKEVAAKKQAIIDGSFHPFQGPIKNQAGEIVVPEGKSLSDEELEKVQWYVEGVVGKLPK
jgi:simple sugar transport system substrate-binding protein